MYHPRCVYATRKAQVQYVQTQLSLYPIYYADDDMFRPLWAILKSQKCIMREIIQSTIIV